MSRHEEDELVSAAEMMGLTREDAVSLHHVYLSVLGRLALEDGTVTQDERSDLALVAQMLGLAADDAEAALVQGCDDESATCEVGKFSLQAGDAVAFTGDAPGIDRTDLEYQARALGLRVTGSVSGKTRLVVAADPDSISGKARKARDLGVPMVDYATYLRMLAGLSRRRAI